MKKRKKNKIYWGEVQEKAIKDYFKMDPESIEAERLFEGVIYGPLKKLVENILFTYRLSVNNISIEEQVHDTIGFIIMKLRKFDVNSGHRSFSYYGTIAKNYLIMKKNKEHNSLVQNVDIEDVIGFEFEQNLYEDPKSDKDLKSYEFLFHNIACDINDLMNDDLTLPPNVYKVAEATTFLLQNYQKINIQNKRQFYFIVREFTGLNAKEITKALIVLKDQYQKTKKSLH